MKGFMVILIKFTKLSGILTKEKENISKPTESQIFPP